MSKYGGNLKQAPAFALVFALLLDEGVGDVGAGHGGSATAQAEIGALVEFVDERDFVGSGALGCQSAQGQVVAVANAEGAVHVAHQENEGVVVDALFYF